MNPVPPVCLGIDGGGTHSLGVAVASDGRVVACARAGSLNFFGSGLVEARRSFEQLLAALKRSLPPGTAFRNAVVGCAALFAEATPQEKNSLCAGFLELEQTRVVSDCQTAYFGATLGEPGVVVIAGTGSIVLAKGEGGQFAQVGGWGHLLGDEGSGWWIARETVRAAIAASENRGPRTALVEAVCQWFNVSALHGIIPILHDRAVTKETFSALAEFLSEHVPTDDAVFREVLTRAGRELAAQALAAAGSAGLRSTPVPVYLVGGVVRNNAQVRESLVISLEERLPVHLETPQLPPALGAAAMALADAGTPLTPELLANLRSAKLPQP